MTLVVIGTNGQLGWELVRSLMPLGKVIGLARSDLDLDDLDSIVPTLRSLRPDVIVNAAAYTAVDEAETNETKALRINGDAVGILAAESAHLDAMLVHYSTDYVFDGMKNAAYVETDPIQPLNVYGRSKAYGERLVRERAADWLVFRTTWVYGARGKNFMRTMMRLATERDLLRVVADQHGAPTSARFLADASAHAIRSAQRERRAGTFRSGLYHLSASGETTWHGFASSIVDEMRADSSGPAVKVRQVDAISAADYPTAARRPGNSLLDNTRFIARFDLHPPPWQEALRHTMREASAH